MDLCPGTPARQIQIAHSRKPEGTPALGTDQRPATYWSVRRPHEVSAEIRKGIIMTSRKWRLASGVGTAIAAGVTICALATGTAFANGDARPNTGITVPAAATAAPVGLVASLEGRNEVTAG